MAKSRVFISYSRRDNEWKDKVLEPLRALEHDGHFDVWADDDIDTGDDWKPEIEKAIDGSEAANRLVTNCFLSSDFINGNELRRILKKRRRGAMRVFPLIVRPCPWQAISIPDSGSDVPAVSSLPHGADPAPQNPDASRQ